MVIHTSAITRFTTPFFSFATAPFVLVPCFISCPVLSLEPNFTTSSDDFTCITIGSITV